MNVTLKDVAKRAGVSRSAVSRTFTEGASVSAKMREKVEKAASELGYSPNLLARSLTTRRTKLIGLISNNFNNPLFLQVFDLFTCGLQECGLRPLLVNLSSETDPQHSLRMLKQYSVDGVIVATSELPTAFSKVFCEAGMPIVHAFGRLARSSKVHTVSIDDIECGRMAARLLIDRGYKSIGFLGGPQSVSVAKDRHNGFQQEAGKHPGIDVSYSFAEAHSFAAGRNEMLRLLKEAPAAAYFCGDDVLSIGAMSAIETHGLKVPEDIGILGLNDMEISGWEIINLTTIQQPIDDIVNSTIQLIEKVMEDPSVKPESRLFPCKVIERGTLKSP